MPTFERDGFSIYYEEAGDTESPAVLLLHGFTSDHRMWLPVAEQLSEDYRIIVPDLRGHGATRTDFYSRRSTPATSAPW